MTIFQAVTPFIKGNNSNLLPPQIAAYEAVHSHYEEFSDHKYREVLVVMPTGSGKTGLMALLPFQISKGRVLIIAPGKIVRKTIFQEFDSISNPEKTFWYKRKVIFDRKLFPKSYLYRGFNPKNDGEKEQTLQKLKMSDIVITNVQKITGSSENVSLINLLDRDFFDMIIIDEAHHSAAPMWQETLSYFNATKIVKLTATPFRGDGLDITENPRNPIFEYSLGEAILDGLVKDVVKEEEVPGTVEFVDNESGQKYSLKQARAILGDDWVNRSVAMSESCSKAVIKLTKEILLEKRNSYPAHQVLAVACHDQHAKDLTKWFNEEGLTATYVSSHLSDKENEIRINDYCNGAYDVIINIQMLGEGFDNPNTSIISIFRPFKTLSPYAQVIGRGLRKIREENTTELENYCNVVYHQELDLQRLWHYYKTQKRYAELKREQYEQIELFDFSELGMIEKTPDRFVPDRTEEPEPKFELQVVGSVSTYHSGGTGNQDSFSQSGYSSYQEARARIIKDEEEKLLNELDKYQKLFDNKLIDEEEYNILKEKAESTRQNKWNKFNDDYKMYIFSEKLRDEFKIWFNNELEKFFKKSKLQKVGFELFLDSGQFQEKVNNVGFIVKNLYKSLYDQTRKHNSLYTPNDFRIAKDSTIQKFNFYLEQYGVDEEEI
ncbi:DEAD/DEAH box helicase [Brevibacillus fortis]|uniref:DEAD/DEAH box helicase n=2 Tax=Bacteria TaxID=2 RepID=UPI0038FCD8E6